MRVMGIELTIEQPASLFVVLYSILWSASAKPWSATGDAAEATDQQQQEQKSKK